MEPPEPKLRRRLRVSLLSLLLLTALAAVSIFAGLLWSEVEPLRREVARLRDEVGELEVTDPTKLHALGFEPETSATCEESAWRVWWPKGETRRLCYAMEGIPATGFPQGNGWAELDGGMPYTIRYAVEKERSSDLWFAQLSWSRSGGGGGNLGVSQVDWSGKPHVFHYAESVGRPTAVFRESETVVLSRHRVTNDPATQSSNEFPDPSQGFMIWIEPVKSSRLPTPPPPR